MRRARDLAERADMRQARGAVAGLEDHLGFRRRAQPLDQLARLLERPGLRGFGGLALGLRRLDPVGTPAWGRRAKGRTVGMRGGESEWGRDETTGPGARS